MITIQGLHNVPQIIDVCNLPNILVKTIQNEKLAVKTGDVICVASKICSMAEGNVIDLSEVIPSLLAQKIHAQIPQKDSRLIQVIIDQTGDPTGKRLEISGKHIGAWLPNGLFLTSAGVDKGPNNTAITLPHDCDQTAQKISAAFLQELGVRVSVIVTDSDGRVDKKGANQVAVGLFGLNGLRINEKRHTAETLCDLLAAAAGIVMGQRGVNIPVACIHGLNVKQSDKYHLDNVLNQK